MLKGSDIGLGIKASDIAKRPNDADIQLPEELQLAGLSGLLNFIPVKVGWKDEGKHGPVFLEDAKGACARGQHWVTRATARKIAKEMKLPFEEY